jgi:hypothetical protein
MEYFILSLYKKRSTEKENTEISKFFEEKIKDSYNYCYLFEIYEYNDVEYTEINVCIENLLFNKDEFSEQLDQISLIAGLFFEKFSSILFGTGVYEIAYDLIKSYKTISEISNFSLQKFPLVFTRKPLDWYTNMLIKRENLVTNVNFKAQDLF